MKSGHIAPNGGSLIEVVETWLERLVPVVSCEVPESGSLLGEQVDNLRQSLDEEWLPDILQSLLCVAGSHGDSVAELRDHAPYESAWHELPSVCAKPREVLAMFLTQILAFRLEDEVGGTIDWTALLIPE